MYLFRRRYGMEDIINKFGAYLPVVTVFLAAFLAYAFNNKRFKFERFHRDAEISLKEFYSPVFHEMRKIKNSDSLYRDKLIYDFVKKHTDVDTVLYRAYNMNLSGLFYDLDEAINEYNKSKDTQDYKECEKIFNSIYIIVKKEYEDYQASLYKHHPWYKHLNKRSYIVRLFMDLSTLFYDTVLWIFLFWLFIFYGILVDRYITKINTPRIIVDNFATATEIIIPLLCLGMMAKIPHFLVTIDYKKENKFVKKLNKKIALWWQNLKLKMENIIYIAEE